MKLTSSLKVIYRKTNGTVTSSYRWNRINFAAERCAKTLVAKASSKEGMELASAAKAAKTMLSMQAPHRASVNGDSNVPQVAAQAANHAAGTQQPAAHTQQSRANATGEQQPGPSRLSAVEPEPSTPPSGLSLTQRSKSIPSIQKMKLCWPLDRPF